MDAYISDFHLFACSVPPSLARSPRACSIARPLSLRALAAAADTIATDAATPSRTVAPPLRLPTSPTPDEGGGSSGAEVLFIVAFILLSGVFARRALSRLPIPYTALLLVWGLVLAAVDQAVDGAAREGPGWESGGTGIALITGMSPTLLLTIFLPVLLFASGFSLEWHLVRKLAGQCLLLAGPGVIISTAALALTAKYIYPYAWTWDEAILFGAMFSATDPVAVVALLKDVGASAKLGTIIEGESLLNDGTAFVLFLIFRDRVRAESAIGVAEAAGLSPDSPLFPAGPPGAGKSIEQFFQLAAAGPLLGLAFGWGQQMCLSLIYNDWIAESTLTVATAFLCFYVAEDLCGSSGVLAVVFLGVYMAARGRQLVSPASEHAMHIVWETLEFFANTVIFVLSGILIGQAVIGGPTTEFTEVEGTNAVQEIDEAIAVPVERRSLSDPDVLPGYEVEGRDWAFGFVLYVMSHVARALVFVLLWPALQRTGYGIDWRSAVVCTWGGLRGAVGLALALLVTLDPLIADPRFKAVVILHMGIMAVMTLLVNGSTTPLVLSALGMRNVPLAKKRFLQAAVAELAGIQDGRCGHLQHDAVGGKPDWDSVRRLTDVEGGAEAGQTAGRGGKSKNELDGKTRRNSFSRLFSNTRSIKGRTGKHALSLPTAAEVITDVRHRYLSAVKSIYAEGFEREYIPAALLGPLREAASAADDMCDAVDPLTFEPLPGSQLARHHVQGLTFSSPIDSLSELEASTLRMPFWLIAVQRPLERILGATGASIWRNLSYQRTEKAVRAAMAFRFAHVKASASINAVAVRAGASIRQLSAEGAKPSDAALVAAQNERDAALRVVREGDDLVARVDAFLRRTRAAYPEVLTAIVTRTVARTVLMHKARFLTGLEHAGLVEPGEIRGLRARLDQRASELSAGRVRGTVAPPPRPGPVLYASELFHQLPYSTFLNAVLPHAKLRTIDVGTPVLSRQKAAHQDASKRELGKVVSARREGSPDVAPVHHGHVVVVVRGVVGPRSGLDGVAQRRQFLGRAASAAKTAMAAAERAATSAAETGARVTGTIKRVVSKTNVTGGGESPGSDSLVGADTIDSDLAVVEGATDHARRGSFSLAAHERADLARDTFGLDEHLYGPGASLGLPASDVAQSAGSSRRMRPPTDEATVAADRAGRRISLSNPYPAHQEIEVVAHTTCEIFEIPIAVFASIADEHPEVLASAHRAAAARAVARHGPGWVRREGATPQLVLARLRSRGMTVLTMSAGEPLRPEHCDGGLVLLRGRLNLPARAARATKAAMKAAQAEELAWATRSGADDDEGAADGGSGDDASDDEDGDDGARTDDVAAPVRATLVAPCLIDSDVKSDRASRLAARRLASAAATARRRDGEWATAHAPRAGAGGCLLVCLPAGWRAVLRAPSGADLSGGAGTLGHAVEGALRGGDDDPAARAAADFRARRAAALAARLFARGAGVTVDREEMVAAAVRHAAATWLLRTQQGRAARAAKMANEGTGAAETAKEKTAAVVGAVRRAMRQSIGGVRQSIGGIGGIVGGRRESAGAARAPAAAAPSPASPSRGVREGGVGTGSILEPVRSGINLAGMEGKRERGQ